MAANMPEQAAVGPLLRDLERHGTVEDLDFDRGFLASEVIHELDQRGMDLRCKPWRACDGVRFSKSRFTLDLVTNTASCPADVTVPIRGEGDGRKACWGTACATCSLQSQCTNARRGRTLHVHPQVDLHQHLQTAQRTIGGRAALRELDRHQTGSGTSGRRSPRR